MTIPTTTYPQTPGWYPDPAGDTGLRWWDGESWTGRRSFPAPDVPLPKLGPRFARLADLLGHLLLGVAALSVVTLVVEAWGYRRLAQFLNAGPGETFDVAAYERLSTVLALCSFALVLVTAVFWCAWQWRLAVSAPGHLRRAPAVHVWSWFVPVANYWIPIQNMTDLWYAYEPREDQPEGPRLSLMFPWWAAWIVTAIVGGMGLRTLFDVHTLDGYLSVAAQGAVQAGVTLVAAVLALLVVRRLSWRALLYHAALD